MCFEKKHEAIENKKTLNALFKVFFYLVPQVSCLFTEKRSSFNWKTGPHPDLSGALPMHREAGTEGGIGAQKSKKKASLQNVCITIRFR